MKNHTGLTRREFIKDAVYISAVVGAMRSADPLLADGSPLGQLPKIKIGELEVSRLILGSNPFFGFSHGNPQATPSEMKEFYTPERIMKVLDAAADHGITAVWSPCYDRWIRVWNDYRERDGKMKIWIAQPDPSADEMEAHITAAAKNGAKAVCIQGIRADEQMAAGRYDVLRDWLELIHSFGMPAGMATHTAGNHLVSEEKGLPTDFYNQTLYRPDNYVPEGLEESLTTIEKLAKPVIAYKVLGAGRIQPKKTLPVVFRRLKRKDGICLGVFPKEKDEIAEDSRLTERLT
ncbi:MAG: hypothetical protein K9N52_09800 [Verrucomicrobia bacterium]|nr:hypothetical protein [Verrucomicrobiota bacterium]